MSWLFYNCLIPLQYGRLKEAKGQSENVLVDVTSFPYDKDIIKHEIRKYFTKHETIKYIAVKNIVCLAKSIKEKGPPTARPTNLFTN